MPSSAEYQDAAAFHARQVDLHETILAAERSESDPVARVIESHTKCVAYHSLALRWLRVGAAMEAGTVDQISLNLSSEGDDDAFVAWTRLNGFGDPQRYEAPDPLTAAERAMGVAT